MFDTHTHAWGPASDAHPWVNGPLLDRVDSFDVHTVYTADRLLADMDRTGVERAVVVGYPICEWVDNWYTIQAATEHDRLYGVVMLDPFATDAADRLRQCMATDSVLGVRLGGACPYDQMWETFDPSVTWLRDAIEETAFWEAAVETGAIVQLLCDHRQLDQAIALVEAYPQLTYLFDHFAHAGPETPLEDGTFTQFTELAAYDNVAVKVSEIPHLSETTFPYEDMHDHVRWLLETFGRERVVWGSDYPNVSDVASYAQSHEWLRSVETLSATDRKWLTETAFCRLAGLH
ncbi:amidohydrolase family protein [Halocatena pleomorpha]|uniref:Amidohydrolase n=1 Tax=Halocatena pleomorpha TaxID=1785090 RepID=A0A3P3RJY4_9EURY|nr:amidohydrolase family protein [Halocatena pleomorpha]RRJ33821.1 amidohydrolase [Halocatena pleomorpha]